MKNPDYRALLENFSSLTALQFVNYVFPIITFPYLVRVLGVEKFGLLSFAQSFVAYFTLLTNYGFYLTGIQQIAIKREDKEESGKILASIIGAKIFLMILSFFIFSLIVFSFKKFRQDYTLYYFCFAIVLVETFTPYWFFRGIEKMRYITILTAISKAFYTAGIFLFVRRSEQVYLVPLISATSTLLVDIEAFRVIYLKFNYKFVIPRTKDIVYQLKDGFTIFMSQVAINLYTTSNTFILGILTNNTYVGYYAAAQKILSIILSLISLVQQTLYPYANRLVATQKGNAKVFFQKLTKIIGISGLIISLFLFIFAPLLVKIILGSGYLPSITTIRILSLLPFLVILSNVFGLLIMLPMGYKAEFMKILWGASIINITFALILVPNLKHNGTAMSATITEMYVTLTMWLFLRRKRITI
ncbi:MAG: flippase [candidate division WOR-3 bacterium]